MRNWWWLCFGLFGVHETIFLFKGKREDPRISVAKAEAVVESFKRIREPALTLKSRQKEHAPICWSPPPTNWFKVNMDAAINFEDYKVGLGVVFRDANKNFVVVAVKTTKLHSDVAFAEAEAVNCSLNIATCAGLSSIIIESDSQVVVDFVNNRETSRTEINWIISEVQGRMKDFTAIKIQYTPRSCNVIAHSLARLTLENDESVVWISSYPSEIMCLLNSSIELMIFLLKKNVSTIILLKSINFMTLIT